MHYAYNLLCGTVPLVAACKMRRIRVSNKFCTRSQRIIQVIFDINFVDIIEVTKSYLYVELEDCYYEENEKYILHYLLILYVC